MERETSEHGVCDLGSRMLRQSCVPGCVTLTESLCVLPITLTAGESIVVVLD